MDTIPNTITSGDSDTTVKLSAEAESNAVASGNDINFGSGDDSLTLEVVGDYFTASTGNDVNGGDGSDSISLDLKSGGGATEVQSFLQNNTINGGDGDNDTLEVLSKKQTIDLTDGIGSNLSNLELIDLGKSKSMLTLDEASVIAATDMDNILFISGKGSVVDLSGGTFAGEVGGYSYFDLGTASVGFDSGVVATNYV